MIEPPFRSKNRIESDPPTVLTLAHIINTLEKKSIKKLINETNFQYEPLSSIAASSFSNRKILKIH
jgi:hypothetical protein